MKFYQKYNKKLKKLGTSPIIATILLIGLTVFSGAVLYGVTTAYLNQPNPVSLTYTNPTVFKTTASNTYFQNSQIDSFDVPVSNPNYQQMTINLAGSKVYYTNGTQLTSWSADSNTSTLLLNGRESTVVTFSTPVGTIGSQELNIGDQIYVNFSIAKPDGSGSKYIKTSTFTVSQTSFEPNFQFVTTSTSVQSNNEVTFYGNSSTQVTLNITGILWNYGNPASSYQKTMNFYVENDTVFTVLPQYATQTITIPSSKKVGDQGNPTSCTAGLACANVTIQVTKNAVNASSPYYGGILSFTGMDQIYFQLNINDPSLKITLSQTTRHSFSFFRNWRHNNYCTSWPNWNNYNQLSDTVVYSGAPNCVDSKTVTFDVWNLRTYQNNATIEIIGLNTTAFTLYTKANATRFNRNTYSDEPQYIILPAGPGRTFRWFNNCRFPTAQACNSVSWGIARNALVDKNGASTGIESGNYPITVRDTQTGIEQTFNLYIEPYIETVHVASMSDSTSSHSFGKGKHKTTYTDLTFTATIENQDGMTLSFVPVKVSYTYPSNGNGNSKTKTTTFTLYTDRNGQVTYTEYGASGTYTFSITNLGSGNNNNGRWGRRFSSTTYIYDSTLDSPSPPTLTYTV